MENMLLQIDDQGIGRPARVITFSSVVGFVSITILIDTMILTFAYIFLWAMEGLFKLSLLPFAILSLLVLLPSIWACVKIAILAFDAETDPANN